MEVDRLHSQFRLSKSGFLYTMCYYMFGFGYLACIKGNQLMHCGLGTMIRSRLPCIGLRQVTLIQHNVGSEPMVVVYFRYYI